MKKSVMDVYQEARPDFRLSKKTATEWAGPCPICGCGRDRFTVTPGRGETGRWMCRQCPPMEDGTCANGDAADLYQRIYGVTLADACRAVGIELMRAGQGQYQGGERRRTSPCKALQGRGQADVHSASATVELCLPPARWSQYAADVCKRAARTLELSEEGRELLASRGISMATARAWGLGWQARDLYEPRALWALSDERRPDGQLRKHVVPAGLVLPISRAGRVIAVVVRRRVPVGNKRYWQVAGGASAVVCRGQAHGPRKPVLVVESYLDAVLAWQEAGDLVDVMALTGATKRPDRVADAWLKAAPLVLVNLDTDEAGRKRTAAWVDRYGARDCQCKRGKDLTEQAQQGLPVRVWLSGCLGAAGGQGQADADVVDTSSDAVPDEQCAPMTAVEAPDGGRQAPAKPSPVRPAMEHDGRCGDCYYWRPRVDADGTRYPHWLGTCGRDGAPVQRKDRCHRGALGVAVGR